MEGMMEKVKRGYRKFNGDKLRRLRTNLRMSSAKVAKELEEQYGLKVTPNSVCFWETGVSCPSKAKRLVLRQYVKSLEIRLKRAEAENPTTIAPTKRIYTKPTIKAVSYLVTYTGGKTVVITGVTNISPITIQSQ